MNPFSKKLCAFLLLMAALAVPAARADWINLTGAETAPNIAEIYVLDDRVRVKLEVYIGDLDKFDDLVPDEWLRDASGRPGLDERLQRFSKKGLQFVTQAGERLQARAVTIEPRLRVDRQSPFAGMINPITRARVPEAPADKRVLYVELDYPFSERPETLVMIPPLDNGSDIAAVTIGFIAYHKSVPVIDFRYLGAPAHLTLDWSDPWYSKFRNVNLKRHHASALMTFIYIEPYEVRHEVLTRVKDLEEWMDLGLRGDEYIELDELEPLKQRIGEFMLERNKVQIDGEAGEPILDRTNYVTVGIQGIRIVEAPERLEISTAIIGVILTYITDGIPREVTVDWELFTDQVQRVPATSTDPAGPLPTFITPDDNVHTWTNYLKNYTLPTVEAVAVAGSVGQLEIPVASAGGGVLLVLLLVVIAGRRKHGASIKVPAIAAGLLVAASAAAWPFARVSVDRPAALAGTLENEQSVALVETLLRNVYRAFDFREPATCLPTSTCRAGSRWPCNRRAAHRRRCRSSRSGKRPRRGVTRATWATTCARNGRQWAPLDTGVTRTSGRISTTQSSRSSRSTVSGKSRAWKCSKRAVSTRARHRKPADRQRVLVSDISGLLQYTVATRVSENYGWRQCSHRNSCTELAHTLQ
jgi:hypothetical protein